MHRIVYSNQANKDIDEIQKFIDNDNINYAKIVIEKIFFSCNNLSLFPMMGKEISDKLGYRQIIETKYKYNIIYQIDGNKVYVVTIYKFKNVDL